MELGCLGPGSGEGGPGAKVSVAGRWCRVCVPVDGPWPLMLPSRCCVKHTLILAPWPKAALNQCENHSVSARHTPLSSVIRSPKSPSWTVYTGTEFYCMTRMLSHSLRLSHTLQPASLEHAFCPQTPNGLSLKCHPLWALVGVLVNYLLLSHDTHIKKSCVIHLLLPLLLP